MKFSLIEFLGRIQNKPRHVRVRVFWLLMIMSMSIILSLWLLFPFGKSQPRSGLTLEANLGEKTVHVLRGETMETAQEAVSMWGALKDSIGAFFEETLEHEENSPVPPVRDDAVFDGVKLPLSY